MHSFLLLQATFCFVLSLSSASAESAKVLGFTKVSLSGALFTRLQENFCSRQSSKANFVLNRNGVCAQPHTSTLDQDFTILQHGISITIARNKLDIAFFEHSVEPLETRKKKSEGQPDAKRPSPTCRWTRGQQKQKNRQPLPSGWMVEWDGKTNLSFAHNGQDGERRWTRKALATLHAYGLTTENIAKALASCQPRRSHLFVCSKAKREHGGIRKDHIGKEAAAAAAPVSHVVPTHNLLSIMPLSLTSVTPEKRNDH
jgi:hypothetical protein